MGQWEARKEIWPCCASSCIRSRKFINNRSSSSYPKPTTSPSPSARELRLENVARQSWSPESRIIFQYRNTNLRPLNSAASWCCYLPEKEKWTGTTGPERYRRLGLHDCKNVGREQSRMDKLTAMKVLIIAGTICSVLQARSGLGYATSFSSNAQQRVFQMVKWLLSCSVSLVDLILDWIPGPAGFRSCHLCLEVPVLSGSTTDRPFTEESTKLENLLRTDSFGRDFVRDWSNFPMQSSAMESAFSNVYPPGMIGHI